MGAEPAAVSAGPFKLDRIARRLFLSGRELTLTSTEFNLLEFFLSHPGRAYSREQLLEAVWVRAAVHHARGRWTSTSGGFGNRSRSSRRAPAT